MTSAIVALILAAALIHLGVALGARAQRWMAGRPAVVDWRGGLVALPRRYLVDVHNVVSRDRTASRMHVMAAGGFVAAVALFVLVHVLQSQSQFLAWLLLAALALMLAGGERALGRRLRRPARLSRGAFDWLPLAIMGFAALLLWLTLPLAGVMEALPETHPAQLVALTLFAASTAFLIGSAASGPMKHALLGALHLVAHPRPARFTGSGPDSGLQPLDLEASRLGVETPADLPWNRLLAADACVQCGRCENACPAFAAGLPLNPKKLIQDIAMAMSGDAASDAGYHGSRYPGLAGRIGHGGAALPLIGADAMIHPHTLWACTTCRACVEECPMLIEHVDMIVDLRRFQTLELGATPGKGPLVLAELAATDNPGGLDPAGRADAFSDLGVRRLGEGESCDVLLWLGDAAFALSGQRSLRALIRLMVTAGVDVAVLGADELDCGDIARRLGDEAQFQRLAKANIAVLAARKLNRIVTADPHALHVLRNEYPAFGGDYEVVHHTAFLLELVESGRLSVVPDEAPLTYHDPCYLGRYNGEYAAPRALIDRLGTGRIEMVRSARTSRCCGGGGGAPVTDVQGQRRIPDMRMDDVRASGAPAVVVACPNCAVMLEGVAGDRPLVTDIAELVLERLAA